MNRFLRTVLLIALLGAAGRAAAALPPSSPVPGGVAVVPVAPVADPEPKVHLGKHRVMVVAEAGFWTAVVGLSLDTSLGEHSLAVDSAGRKGKISFDVLPKQYAEQRLTVKNKRHVNPNAEDLARIGREKTLIQAAFGTWSGSAPATLGFELPVTGTVSSPFGLRRYFNDQPRRPHSGLDIAAPRGTPVTAPAAGRVIETGNYFFNGNTVFIDHGQGLVSMFCHLDRIDVHKGEILDRGEKVGVVGATGRVTGPHLHWSVSLNESRVDPVLFVPALLAEQHPGQ
jgi:murein DD-endopeptidase MepM/ murein hydrolase activator NlpD